MTMTTRSDGSRYPDHDEQCRFLADFTDPDADTGPGYAYNVTVGDLIVEALIGRDLIDAPTGAHEDWESFEGALLGQVALELRVLGEAMEGDLPEEAASKYLKALARRTEAATELASRLRDARWGHPSFGGGEARLAADREALMQKRAEGAEGSEVTP
jgi:hypothetical protein